MTSKATVGPSLSQPESPTRVIVIAGPTAVGKSALALELCSILGGELISADSVQVYKGLDIGSNKPSAAERASVVHHLIDVVEPNEERFTAGRFVRECDSAIDEAAARGKVPIVCGGTPLYLQWLVHGVPDAPASDPAMASQAAAALAPFEQSGDWGKGLATLEALGGTAAAENARRTLSENDWYRLSRTLEIALISRQNLDPSSSRESVEREQPQLQHEGGQQLESVSAPEHADVGDSSSSSSAHMDDDGRSLQAAATPEQTTATRNNPPRSEKYDFRSFFLSPTDRWELFERIDERCEQMLVGEGLIGGGTADADLNSATANATSSSDTLLQETCALLSSQRMNPDSLAGRAIGYRQAIDYLLRPPPLSPSSSGGGDPGDEAGFLSFVREFGTATRNYASQQLKWFRKDEAFLFVPVPVSPSRLPPPPPPPLSKTKLKKLRKQQQQQQPRGEREVQASTSTSSGSSSSSSSSSNNNKRVRVSPEEGGDGGMGGGGAPPSAEVAADAGYPLMELDHHQQQQQQREQWQREHGAARDRILALWRGERPAFEAELAHPEQQAIRDGLSGQSKKMRTYSTKLKLLTHAAQPFSPTAPQGLPPTAAASTVLGTVLARADEFTAQLRSQGLARSSADLAQGQSRLLPPPLSAPPISDPPPPAAGSLVK